MNRKSKKQAAERMRKLMESECKAKGVKCPKLKLIGKWEQSI